MAFRLKVERIIDPGGRRVVKRVSEERLLQSLFRILQETVLCSMATVNGLNRAYINTAYFSYSQDLVLYFLSHRRAVHCRNLVANPSMAMTVFDSSQAWGNPDRGLQLFGNCQEAQGRQITKAERVYSERFLEYARQFALPASRLRSYRFYRLVPRRVKVFDEREFGPGVFVVASVIRTGTRGRS